jgi:hypothetical protein
VSPRGKKEPRVGDRHLSELGFQINNCRAANSQSKKDIEDKLVSLLKVLPTVEAAVRSALVLGGLDGSLAAKVTKGQVRPGDEQLGPVKDEDAVELLRAAGEQHRRLHRMLDRLDGC